MFQITKVRICRLIIIITVDAVCEYVIDAKVRKEIDLNGMPIHDRPRGSIGLKEKK